MGTFREKAKIINPVNRALSVEIEMIVDSGATYTQVPASILTKLNIDRKFKRNLKIATGEIIEREAGEIQITVKGETLTTLVIFGDEASEPLLGAVTLEQFGLAVDPINKTLIPVPELMLYSGLWFKTQNFKPGRGGMMCGIITLNVKNLSHFDSEFRVPGSGFFYSQSPKFLKILIFSRIPLNEPRTTNQSLTLAQILHIIGYEYYVFSVLLSACLKSRKTRGAKWVEYTIPLFQMANP